MQGGTSATSNQVGRREMGRTMFRGLGWLLVGEIGEAADRDWEWEGGAKQEMERKNKNSQYSRQQRAR
jgi:hypothetical protein